MYIKTTPISGMKDAYSVTGKNVVITGGNRGIGRGITQAFAESGANVAILCRDIESGNAAAADLKKFGGRYTAIRCDVADAGSVNAAADEVFKFYENVDVLVNNAGVATTTPFLSEKGMDEWHRVINTNLHGPANVIYAIAPHMVTAGKGGTIINISSVGGQRVSASRNRHNAPYNASKAALDIFTRYLAIALGDSGIGVNSISPGPFHTDLDNLLPPGTIEKTEEELPAHRFGDPLEIGALCVYMASPAGAQCRGANWALDGGLLCVK